MPINPQSVRTAADELYELVNREKEISFKDAAIKLRVPLETIEAWATFLEEDGFLSIKYKLTTPYLIVPSDNPKEKKQVTPLPKLFQEKVEEAEIKTDLDSAQELLKTVRHTQAEGEFGLVEKTSNQLLSTLKKSIDFITSKATISPQAKAQLLEKLASIEKKHAASSKLLKTNQFDQANATYATLYAEMQQLLETARSHYADVEEMDSLDEQGVKKYLQKTYALLEEGKLAEAAEHYEKLKSMFAQLSQKFSLEKSELEESILKLNRDIGLYSVKARNSAMQQGTLRITEHLQKAGESLRSKEFGVATAHYLEMKRTFEKLPSGFANQKSRIKKDILKVYEQIAIEREKQLRLRFTVLSKQIKSILSELSAALKRADLATASKAYQNVKLLYEQLPAGFLKEKYALQNSILASYHAFSAQQEQYVESDLASKTTRILGLLEELQRHIHESRLQEAEQLYAQISSIYSTVPEGFVESKTQLQERIVRAYEALLEKKDAQQTNTFTAASQHIDNFVVEARKIIDENPARAHELYQQAKIAYAALPAIDVNQRQMLRNKLLLLYRAILMTQQKSGSVAPLQAAQPLFPKAPARQGLQEPTASAVPLPLQTIQATPKLSQTTPSYAVPALTIGAPRQALAEPDHAQLARQIDALKSLSKAQVKPPLKGVHYA